MTSQTIEQAKQLRDEIRKGIKGIRVTDYEGHKYGEENEYTAKGVLVGLKALLIDISAFTKAPTKCLQVSSYKERVQFVRYLSALSTAVANKELAQIASFIDQIKPQIRDWGIRNSEERFEEFRGHVNELQRKAQSLSEQIEETVALRKQGGELNDEIKAIHGELKERLDLLGGQESELEELVSSARSKRDELAALLLEDEERSERIEQILASARSHEEVIESFSKKVGKREAQLENQEVVTQNYKERLGEMEKERVAYLEEAKDLVESARLALEYKTAEGLSAAFSAQYSKASSFHSFGWWIIAAVCFLVSALGIGIWTISDQDVTLENVVARLSLMPIVIGASWFCARQYVRQKSISEDYAYKSVLAKSIVGFSDQLSSESSKGDDYSHFIKSVLAQIHIDPLGRNIKVRQAEEPAGDEAPRYIDELAKLTALIASLERQIKSQKA